jgi:hypothetical protein
MNTYDPADKLVYVHMAHDVDPYTTPLQSGRIYHKLPDGYANRSSRTRLEGNKRASEASGAGSPPQSADPTSDALVAQTCRALRR